MRAGRVPPARPFDAAAAAAAGDERELARVGRPGARASGAARGSSSRAVIAGAGRRDRRATSSGSRPAARCRRSGHVAAAVDAGRALAA